MNTIFTSSSSASIDRSQWFIQLLFGRYRNVNNFTYLHLIIIIIIAVLVVYIYLTLLSLKFQKYRKLLASTATTTTATKNYSTTIELPITRFYMNQKLFHIIQKYDLLYSTICHYHIQPEDNSSSSDIMLGDSGWGIQYIAGNTSVSPTSYTSLFPVNQYEIHRDVYNASHPLQHHHHPIVNYNVKVYMNI